MKRQTVLVDEYDDTIRWPQVQGRSLHRKKLAQGWLCFPPSGVSNAFFVPDPEHEWQGTPVLSCAVERMKKSIMTTDTAIEAETLRLLEDATIAASPTAVAVDLLEERRGEDTSDLLKELRGEKSEQEQAEAAPDA